MSSALLLTRFIVDSIEDEWVQVAAIVDIVLATGLQRIKSHVKPF